MNGKPLVNQSILVTRAGKKGEALATKIEHLGGRAKIIPLIDFKVNHDPNGQKYMSSLQQYDWIVFTSQNGVYYFFQHLKEYYSDDKVCQLLKQRVAAVGKKTKEALESLNVKVDFVPKVYSASNFIDEFINSGLLAERVLLPKGNLASKTISKGFREHNIKIDEWIVYQTFLPNKSRQEMAVELKKNQIDIVTLTSPSCFYHLMDIVQEYHLYDHVDQLEFVTIGNVTKRAVEEKGFIVSASPPKYTMDAMLDSLCELVKLKEEMKQ